MQSFKKATLVLVHTGLWPAVMLAWPAALVYMLQQGYGVVWAYHIVYLSGVVGLFLLEQIMPYSRKWQKVDSQWVGDLVHTVLSRSAGGFVLRLTGLWVTVHIYGQYYAPSVWQGVHFWLQILAAMVVCEFGRYWYHRLTHERWGGWVFHALHHISKRLWVGNASRMHFLDGASLTFFGFVGLFLAQFPPMVIFWVVALNSFIGTLAHSNIQMRLGGLNYLFNTPVLHRWHHSRTLSEASRNYGLSLTLWDHVFGTYYNPDRASSETIGIRNMPFPDAFLKQLYTPITMLRTGVKPFCAYVGEKKKGCKP